MSLYLQMSAPVSGERRMKKSRLSHQSASAAARMASHVERDPVRLQVCESEKKGETAAAVSVSSLVKNGRDGRLDTTVER